ncbi:hypothetical protein ACFFX0_23180 [Citricoccus parietis]|uniref:Uncharacterized protein n=1 Tax=Citricoccus parietis TaxID=592307 RepID=A0ABV5G4S2_9MICC
MVPCRVRRGTTVVYPSRPLPDSPKRSVEATGTDTRLVTSGDQRRRDGDTWPPRRRGSALSGSSWRHARTWPVSRPSSSCSSGWASCPSRSSRPSSRRPWGTRQA